ncbi:MFS family permease [Novosphingobium chloroacetimidivorans]|uniref:MFS family permease n=1 Tax=Novosphingobium chloroacetimidivorans TaxID=1428314 RepID=A0A7W7NWZ2_9SPHN|nr:MFS transporter [Novosphingobium chloroacetimidivorans]MBB4858607.1 MFS family permease [Novosphingobium chloroacetimidivorans]
MSGPRRPAYKIAPDGLPAAVFLAFLATAGLFYVNIMAAIVDGLVSGLGFTDAQAGQVAAVNTYGAAIGAVLSIFTIARLPWRRTAIVCLVALIGIDLLSIWITGAAAMIALRSIHGLVGGLLVGTGMGVIGRTANPDRSFGMLLFVQFGLGGLGVLLLPRLVPLFGVAPLFLSLALFSLVTTVMLPFLPDYPPRPTPVSKPDDATGTVVWTPLILAVSALFLFQAANMALLAYIFRLGVVSGLSRNEASGALGLATWVALAGPLLVMILGRRYGRFGLLFVGMLLTLGGNALFHWSGYGVIYLLANCATGITWGLVVPYLFGMTAEFDSAGRTAAAASVISKLGLASGPLIASFILGSGAGFNVLINSALAAMALAMVLMLPPALALDRRARRNEKEEKVPL